MVRYLSMVSVLILFLLASLRANAIEPLLLNSGQNLMDLNADGTVDSVFLAQDDNNTSHPNPGITFFILKPEGGYSMPPAVKGGGFTNFKLLLAVTNELLIDFRLYHYLDQFYFVTAEKKGSDPYASALVLLTLYQLEKMDDHPGASLYSWQPHSSMTTINTYHSVDSAFNECNQRCFSQ